MALEEPKYSKKDLAKLEALKAAAEAEKKLKKELLKKEEESAKTLEISKKDKELDKLIEERKKKEESFSDAIALELLEKETKGHDGVDFTVEELTDLGVYTDPKTTTPQDIIDVIERKEFPIATKTAHFQLDYEIEPIPRPDLHQVYGLTIRDKKVFHRLRYVRNAGDTDFEIQDYELRNFMKQEGGIVEILVNGSSGTNFNVVIYNETDDTYYYANHGPEEASFTAGIKSVPGVIGKGEKKVSFRIPPSATEKCYKISLANDISLNTYSDLVPLHGVVEKPPLSITQLPNPTTTIKFNNESGNFINQTGDLEISHLPGAKLDRNAYTQGEYTIDLSVTSKKVLSLNTSLNTSKVDLTYSETPVIGAKLRRMNIDSDGYDLYTETTIKKFDLTAYITNNIGYVKGTITIGKSCLRSCDVLIRAEDIFNLE